MSKALSLIFAAAFWPRSPVVSAIALRLSVLA
jgi:hypothetical protein